MKYYIGIDAGKENMKAVVISRNDIIYKVSVPTKKVIEDIKYVFKLIKDNIPCQISNIGVTGENRFIVGKFLATEIIINEIESIYSYSNERKMEGTVLEISSDNSKTLKIKNGKLIDYQIYKSSNLINTNFIYKVAYLLKKNIETITLVKEDINFQNNNLLLLYEEIQKLNNNHVDSNKILSSLIKKMFKELPKCDYLLGYFSKNKSILKYLQINTEWSDYYLALGVSYIAKNTKSNKIYNLDIEGNTIERIISTCHKCPSQCEIVSIYRNNELIDSYGNNCEKGKIEEFRYSTFT